MAKNDFLARQRAIQHGFFEAGLRSGRQQILDMVSLVLRDPEIMGKDTFGKDRLLKVVKGVGEKIDLYQKAWEKDDETDYYRDKLDSITHCNNCAHSDTIDCSDGMVWCGRMCRYMKEDGFCSFGERKTDEG